MVSVPEWLGVVVVGYCAYTDVGVDGLGWNADQLTFWFALF